MFCIGKSLAGLLWAVIYIYTTEIYPTNVRGLGAGIGSGTDYGSNLSPGF